MDEQEGAEATEEEEREEATDEEEGEEAADEEEMEEATDEVEVDEEEDEEREDITSVFSFVCFRCLFLMHPLCALFELCPLGSGRL